MDYAESQTWQMTPIQGQILAFVVIALFVWYLWKRPKKEDKKKCAPIVICEYEFIFVATGKLGRSTTTTEVTVTATDEDKARIKALKELTSDVPIDWTLKVK